MKRTNSPAPKWILLYALVPIALGLLWVADLIPEAGIWRVLSECGAVSAVCGLAIAWVRGNRIALTQMDSWVASEADSAVVLQENLVTPRQRPRRFRPQTVAASPTRLPIAR